MLLVSEPILGTEEKKALSSVIDCGWITMGERVRDFELAFAETHGVKDAVAVNSCTAALHLIMQGMEIGPGDEVLVPSLTFVATVNCILYCGASPVFVDIDSLERPLMSRADAAAKCTDKTKAVILVHYAGYPADRDAWRDFADARGLLLIEDAAHAAGAAEAGSFGCAAAFSFYGNKNMTTAEGGIVLSPDPDLLDKIRQLRSHGMTTGTFQRFSKGTTGYDVTMLGYNYRMDEFRAAVGLAQLKHLTHWNEIRRELTHHYMRSLAEYCPDVLLPFLPWCTNSNRTSAHHIMPIVLTKQASREGVVRALRDVGVQTSNHYPPVHLFSFYRSHFPSVHLPLTEEFAKREITLPLHPKMTARQVEEVAVALRRSLINETLKGNRYGDPANA